MSPALVGRYVITEPPGEALSLCWNFVTILVLFYVLGFFFGNETCGQLEIEPTSPGLEAQSLNHWTTREVPMYLTFLNYLLFLLVLRLCCCVGFL